MSLVDDLVEFNKHANKCQNKYLATLYIASAARKLLKKYDNALLESEALTWIIRGVNIKVLKQVQRIQSRRSFQLSYIDEVLCYVDDTDIKEGVRSSIVASKHARNLVYIYNVSNIHKQARIRILTRIIWYELFPE